MVALGAISVSMLHCSRKMPRKNRRISSARAAVLSVPSVMSSSLEFGSYGAITERANEWPPAHGRAPAWSRVRPGDRCVGRYVTLFRLATKSPSGEGADTSGTFCPKAMMRVRAWLSRPPYFPPRNAHQRIDDGENRKAAVEPQSRLEIRGHLQRLAPAGAPPATNFSQVEDETNEGQIEQGQIEPAAEQRQHPGEIPGEMRGEQHEKRGRKQHRRPGLDRFGSPTQGHEQSDRSQNRGGGDGGNVCRDRNAEVSQGRGQEKTAALEIAFLVAVLAEKSEDAPADAQIGQIASDERQREGRRHAEVPFPPQGGRDREGERLDQAGKRQCHTSSNRPLARSGEQGEAEECDRRRVDVAGTCELPDR